MKRMKKMTAKPSRRIAEKIVKINPNRLIRSGVTFVVLMFLVAAAFTLPIFADEPVAEDTAPDTVAEDTAEVGDTDADETESPPPDSALYELIGVDGSQPLQILLLLTIISVAPSILLMMTCFTRIIIVLGFLRNAMSTQSTPPNQVLVGLALFMTMFIMWPVFAEINEEAYQPHVNGELTAWEAVETAGGPLKKFMLLQTSNNSLSFFMGLAETTLYDLDEDGHPSYYFEFSDEIDIENYREQLPLRVVIPAFMVSELSRAFQMGFLLFLPFLIIDMVVAATLMSMGMMMLPPAMISMPFKIMLFVLVDGWQLLVGTLVESFNYTLPG
ncbi:MAG: flagellar type III secretion system pore protein FliP [Oscillospiraceae bacterium]|nr:flagellar type III secretion system pore protein FliP [Oscillospiraceae bacterium]